MPIRPAFAIVALAAACTCLHAAPVSEPKDLISLEVVDLTPKFLKFYRAAVAQKLDSDARWRLWKEQYGFAAVPPTPEGDAIARKLLDGAWDRYAQALPVIEAGGKAMQPQPDAALREVAHRLGLTTPLRVKVVVYVGGFDDNAFSFAQDGVSIVCIPIEMPRHRREMVLRHELTHAVHIATAGLSGGWERSIAEVILQEGLAMRTAQALLPGRKPEEFIEDEANPGWLSRADAKRSAVLEGIRPSLLDSQSATVFKYTMGNGATGMNREAYFAGWIVVDNLRKRGMSLAEIAHLPSASIAKIVDESIAAELRQPQL
jgi:hypothetical protein